MIVSRTMKMEYKYAMTIHSRVIEKVGYSFEEKTTVTRYRNKASIAAKAKLRGSANDIAFEFLPLIRIQALSIEIYPPFASIPDKTKAKLLITKALARIIE